MKRKARSLSASVYLRSTPCGLPCSLRTSMRMPASSSSRRAAQSSLVSTSPPILSQPSAGKMFRKWPQRKSSRLRRGQSAAVLSTSCCSEVQRSMRAASCFAAVRGSGHSSNLKPSTSLAPLWLRISPGWSAAAPMESPMIDVGVRAPTSDAGMDCGMDDAAAGSRVSESRGDKPSFAEGDESAKSSSASISAYSMRGGDTLRSVVMRLDTASGNPRQ
mmetsp:Transcript_18499/g.56542  ORF Transcript_18499/g.56542 Transcript_18499/m.56542 type:complete len:218 (-) Transcript_18499:86-739(-)